MSIPTSELPKLSTLIQDYFSNYEKVADFYNGNFRDQNTFLKRIDEVVKRQLPRQQLASLLIKQNEAFGCDNGTIKNINSFVIICFINGDSD